MNCADEVAEQGVWAERLRPEFGVKLYSDEPRMIGELNHLDKLPVGRTPRNSKAMLAELVLELSIEFVPVSVALADQLIAIDPMGE